MEHTFKPNGVCSVKIDFELDGDKIRDLKFKGGCEGNLKAIGKLVEGMPADKVIELLDGNTCGYKKTSCADQLAQALKKAIREEE